VKARYSLAVNRKLGFTAATLRHQSLASWGLIGP
jgi:hypothetical protein